MRAASGTRWRVPSSAMYPASNSLADGSSAVILTSRRIVSAPDREHPPRRLLHRTAHEMGQSRPAPRTRDRQLPSQLTVKIYRHLSVKVTIWVACSRAAARLGRGVPLPRMRNGNLPGFVTPLRRSPGDARTVRAPSAASSPAPVATAVLPGLASMRRSAGGDWTRAPVSRSGPSPSTRAAAPGGKWLLLTRNGPERRSPG